MDGGTRRIARVLLSPAYLVALLQPGEHHYRVEANALPADAVGLHVATDPLSNACYLFVQSETFAEVPYGHAVPVLPDIYGVALDCQPAIHPFSSLGLPK